MTNLRRPSFRRWAAPVAATAILLSGGAAVAQASTQSGRGPNEFGMTMGAIKGGSDSFTYTHGYYCDTSIPSTSVTGCEVGAAAKVAPAPASQRDPLYITVPLGFSVAKMDCPSGLTCVDHPMSLDMTRLASALAPIYKTTPSALLPALKEFATPGHDHFITTTNGGRPEWWDVYVVGVTSPSTYKQIEAHHSYSYIQGLMKAKDPHVVGPIPTNLFLYFAA